MDMFPFQISGLGATTAVMATSVAGGLKVDWQYSGSTPEFFYVQLWRNGSFKGNTEVAPNLRTYTYAGEVPSASNKLHFVVYAKVPGVGLKEVGTSVVYAAPVVPATPVPAPTPQPTSATTQGTATDSEVIKELNKISNEYLELPLTPAMQEEYLLKYNQYRGTGMAAAQALARIEQEFAEALENEDIAFYESRTGDIITGEGYEDEIDPELLPYVQKTAGASGGTTNLLIYGAIAAAGLFLLFGNNKKKGKGLSGTKSGKQKNPKIGQFVFDKHYKTKKKVQAVPKKGNSLYFIGQDHEPARREEFVFPLPSTTKKK